MLPGSRADVERARRVLEQVARFHTRIEHPHVPRVFRAGDFEGTPFIEFDCPATIDGTDVLRLLSETQRTLPHGAANALIVSLHDALGAAHRGQDDQGQPLCIGRLSAGNILFAPEGQSWIFGFGRNFVVERENGVVDDNVAFFQAPELAVGGKPSPMGDYAALLLFLRSALPYVDETLALADRRGSLEGALIDPEGFAAFIADLLRTHREGEIAPRNDSARPPAFTVTLTPECTWVELHGERRERLTGARRRLLHALVKGHRDGHSLTTHDLIEAGWPGEHPVYEAGANRVHVALTQLQELGVPVERFDGAYRLDPRTRINKGS